MDRKSKWRVTKLRKIIRRQQTAHYGEIVGTTTVRQSRVARMRQQQPPSAAQQGAGELRHRGGSLCCSLTYPVGAPPAAASTNRCCAQPCAEFSPFAHSMRGCTGTDVCTDMIALLLRSMAGVLRRRNSTIRGEGVNGTHATGLVWASVVTSTAESRRGRGTARPLALLSAHLPPSRLPLWSRGGAG